MDTANIRDKDNNVFNFKIFKDHREYWKPENQSLRANLPERKIIPKKVDNFLPGRKIEEVEKNFSN